MIKITLLSGIVLMLGLEQIQDIFNSNGQTTINMKDKVQSYSIQESLAQILAQSPRNFFIQVTQTTGTSFLLFSSRIYKIDPLNSGSRITFSDNAIAKSVTETISQIAAQYATFTPPAIGAGNGLSVNGNSVELGDTPLDRDTEIPTATFSFRIGAMTISSDGVTVSVTPTLLASQAIVQIDSTEKGVLIPRMTSAQRLAITPVEALTVYETDTQSYWWYNLDLAIWQQVVSKDYVDNGLLNVQRLMGAIDASTDPNFPAATQGDAYYISVAGKIGGALGPDVQVGDYIAAVSNNAGGDFASVGSDWIILENNAEQATTTILGYVRLATALEVVAGVDDKKAITPKALKDAGFYSIPRMEYADRIALPSPQYGDLVFQTDTIVIDPIFEVYPSGYYYFASNDEWTLVIDANENFQDISIKGQINANANPNYPDAKTGDLYIVISSGRVGGALGKIVNIGDVIFCNLTTASGNEATVGSNWTLLATQNTASNGLTKLLKDYKLGGTLSEDTTINVSTFTLLLGLLALNQNGASINGTLDAGASFQVNGVDKGVVVNRMTRAQRVAIATFANSMLVFQTDTVGTDLRGFYYRDSVSSSWIRIYTTVDAVGNMRLTGTIANANTNPNYPAALKGEAYNITTNAGAIGGIGGKTVNIGDVVICLSDSVAGDEVAVGANWTVLATQNTASNGLTKLLKDYKLGGGLTENTVINPSTFSLAIGTGAAPASVVFDVQSTTKASRPSPSMTAAQRRAIPSPAAGSTVYQTDELAGRYLYDGKSWNWLDMKLMEEHWRNSTVAGEIIAFTSSTNGLAAAVASQLTANIANSGAGTNFTRVGRIQCILPAAAAGRAQLYRNAAAGNLAMTTNCAWYVEAELTYTAPFSTILDSAIWWFGVAFGLTQWGVGNTEMNNVVKIRPPFSDDAAQTFKFVVRTGGVDTTVIDTGISYTADTSIKKGIFWNGFTNEMTFIVSTATGTFAKTIQSFTSTYPGLPLAAQSGFNLQRSSGLAVGVHNLIVDVYREWFYKVPYHTDNLASLYNP